MTIYSNGTKIKEVYAFGQKVTAGYAFGEQIFSTATAGWSRVGTMTMTVTAANSNSISGTITYGIYEYTNGSTVTDRYYEREQIALTRINEGYVTLNFGAGTVFYLGDENTSAEYFFPSSGQIQMSATELSKVYRFKKHTGLLDLGSAQSVTSNYIWQSQNMKITVNNNALVMATGWTISQTNTAARMQTSVTASYTLDALSVPSDGTWPVYAVAGTGLEANVTGLTAAPNVYQNYPNIRMMGLVTVYGGAITNFENIWINTSATGTTMTKSISGSTLTVTGGYALDTDGMLVYVPTATYSFADMVAAAKDTLVPETLSSEKVIYTDSVSNVTPSRGIKNMWPSGSIYYNKIASGNKRLQLIMRLAYSSGGRVDHYSILYSKYQGVTHAPTPLEITYDLSSLSDYQSRQTISSYYVPENSTVYQIQATINKVSTSKTTLYYHAGYKTVEKEASTTPGTTQTRTIWAKVTRSTTNGTSSYAGTQTSTGDSVPYVSYIPLGTITVTRNSDTGSIA